MGNLFEKKPFKGLNSAAITWKVVHESIRPPLENITNYPDHTINLITKSWDHDPKNRPSMFQTINNIDQISNNDYLRVDEVISIIKNFNFLHGKIMVIGGHGGKEILSNVAILDLYTKNLKIVKNMSFPRSHHCAVEWNGKVYCLGGCNVSRINNIESYDINKNESYKETSLNESRNLFSTVAYENAVYALSGLTNNKGSKTVETYDPRVGKWEYISSINKERFNFGTIVKGNCIYAIGGVAQNTIKTFDIRTNTWRYCPKLNFETDLKQILKQSKSSNI